MIALGIGRTGLYVPEGGRNIVEERVAFGFEEPFIRDKSGFVYVRRRPHGVETSDMAVAAFRDLVRKTELRPRDVQCLVVCSQNPDKYGLPHTSAVVHAKLGLEEDCAAFDLSLGCSGYVYGISIIKAFMEANGMSSGVLITADPYSKVIDETDRNTAVLFGDGAAATHITSEPRWTIGGSSFASSGRDSAAIAVDDSRTLQMNGRAVFNFTATKVPRMVTNLLARNALTADDVDLFLLHQGSRYIVETIADRLAIDRQKAPFSAANIGNTVSSSIPFLLDEFHETDAKTVLMAGFGVGLSWAASILHSTRV